MEPDTEQRGKSGGLLALSSGMRNVPKIYKIGIDATVYQCSFTYLKFRQRVYGMLQLHSGT